MKKLKAKITISRPSSNDGDKYVSIKVKDVLSRASFVELQMDFESFTSALMGMAETECEMEVRHLDVVGMSRETQTLEFDIQDADFSNRKEFATLKAKILAPDGWVSEGYFGSQNSFFTKDGVDYARTTIMRWV